MDATQILDKLGLDRAISVDADTSIMSEGESAILSELKTKSFGVDSVYFSVDEKTGNSFPAVFIKKVSAFDSQTLKSINEVHRKSWNYKKVLFLYVYSDTEVRIYNCSEKPILTEKLGKKLETKLQDIEVASYKLNDKQNLDQLIKLFSRVAIDSGIIWIDEEAKFVRDKINLKNRVDKFLVTSLIHTSNQLVEEGVELEYIHRIILRSLFLLYLEDRGATKGSFYSEIKKGATSYFHILDDAEATNKLFEKLDSHFNGNIFKVQENEVITIEQLKVLKRCFISGNDGTGQVNLFEDLRLFDFSIIQIELLSEIYENFLLKTDPELKKNTGTYYTPPALVEFILNDNLPSNIEHDNYNLKILDPSCGSGIFLVQSFKRLVKRYTNKHNSTPDFTTLKEILTENIFGIDLNPQAIKVAAFSLYLALVDNLNPKTLWQNENYRLPYLINDPNDSTIEIQGKNLYCRDTILENNEIEQIEFDLVVGNPPFGTRNRSQSIIDYCNEQKFAQEMALPFLHKATKFAPTGKIALIFNTKVLTNTGGTYQSFRKWFFNNCHVEKVFNFSILRKAPEGFGGQLFGGATGPISIVYYQKETPDLPNDKIVYYAPKTYVKTNIIEGLSIDSTDIKYLPRVECQKPNTTIWKVAMWGGMKDWRLIKKLKNDFSTFKEYLIDNNIEYGSGLHPKESDSKKIDVAGLRIKTSSIERYYTPLSNAEKVQKEFRKNNLNLFKSPLAVLKEGITDRNIYSSYFDYDIFYNKAVYGFATKTKEQAKSIAIIFNSSFAEYFLFLSSSSLGIERDRIILSDYLKFPYLKINNIASLSFKDINFNNSQTLFKDKSTFPTEEVNKKIYSLYGLTTKEITSIQDTINYSVNLFYNQANSIALKSVNQVQVMEYAKILSNEQNSFLEDQDLYTNTTIYTIDRFSPLMMIKLSFEIIEKEMFISDEKIDQELNKIDKYLWEKKATNIYFRKKLNYKNENDIYIIRPNQQRFWTKSMALEDASELILEILNEN